MIRNSKAVEFFQDCLKNIKEEINYEKRKKEYLLEEKKRLNRKPRDNTATYSKTIEEQEEIIKYLNALNTQKTLKKRLYNFFAKKNCLIALLIGYLFSLLVGVIVTIIFDKDIIKTFSSQKYFSDYNINCFSISSSYVALLIFLFLLIESVENERNNNTNITNIYYSIANIINDRIPLLTDWNSYLISYPFLFKRIEKNPEVIKKYTLQIESKDILELFLQEKEDGTIEPLDKIVYLAHISRLCYIKDITKKNGRFLLKDKNNDTITIQSIDTLHSKSFYKLQELDNYHKDNEHPIKIRVLKPEGKEETSINDHTLLQKRISSCAKLTFTLNKKDNSENKVVVIKNYLKINNTTLTQTLLYDRKYNKIISHKSPITVSIDYDELTHLLIHPILTKTLNRLYDLQDVIKNVLKEIAKKKYYL